MFAIDVRAMELARLNRALQAINRCHEVLVRATSEEAIFSDICRIMCDTAGYRMAWIGSVEHDEAKSVRPIAWAGADDGYLASAAITWADCERGHGPTGTAARTGRVLFFQDFTTEPAAAPWREAALARGFRSSIALPLTEENGNVQSVLTLYTDRPHGFTPGEVELLQELARDVAYSVQVLRDRARREAAEDELRQTRDYLDNLIDHANAPIIVWSTGGKITRFNHAFERLTGLTSIEVIGQPLEILFPQDSRAGSMEHIQRASSGEHWEAVEIPILHKGGAVHTVLWNSATIYSADGKEPLATIAQGQDITHRKQVEEQLRASEAKLQQYAQHLQEVVLLRTTELEAANRDMTALARRLLGIQEAERRQVARELHDEIGQQLTLTKLTLDRALRSPTAQQTAVVGEAASQVKAAVEMVRNISLDLRPAMLDDLGLVPALRWLFERLEKQSGFKVTFDTDGRAVKATPEVEVSVYRIIQESLTNALRYSGAGGATVRLAYEDKSIKLAVIDQGQGFDKESLSPASSTGLSAMQERAKLLSGDLTVQSFPGKGTRVEASLPCEQPETDSDPSSLRLA